MIHLTEGSLIRHLVELLEMVHDGIRKSRSEKLIFVIDPHIRSRRLSLVTSQAN
ncbi:MAG: hypothetical protein ACQEXX_30975 [Bacillota bacterium]